MSSTADPAAARADVPVEAPSLGVSSAVAPVTTSSPSPPGTQDHPVSQPVAVLLLVTVMLIATCGLVYELLVSTLASYVLGDAVLQYSTVIGVYLSAMGLGAWLSGLIERRIARTFIEVELAVALVGGISAPLLFFAFAHLSWFRVALYGVVGLIGTLVGTEIPLLLRILKSRYALKDLVARVLTFDYAGALVGSLAFPIFLMPRLGLVRTSLLIGIINALCALGSTYLLAHELKGALRLRVRAWLLIAALALGIAFSERITLLAEEGLYADDIIYAKQTPYQRIVVTRNKASFQLFLNGNLQFSSVDEYRYHEALVWPAVALRAEAGLPTRRVLVLGGGDGLAVRELLRIPTLEQVVLVDLDPGMTTIANSMPLLRQQNEGSLSDPRVRVIHQDAYVWLAEEGAKEPPFDALIADFPDPNHYALGKLYSTRIYRLMRDRLGKDGVLAVQSTSPLFARKSFWCIATTIERAGFAVAPYHVHVPSFGEWGFVLARVGEVHPPTQLPASKKAPVFLDDRTLAALFVLSRDMSRLPVEVNRLDNQVLVHYYEAEWRRFL